MPLAESMIIEGPHCFVCNEELKPNDNATFVIAGPNIGKFVHRSHPKHKEDVYAG